MKRYSRKLFFWSLVSAICLIGIVGTDLSSRYDKAVYLSSQATADELTAKAPTNTPTIPSTHTPTLRPTITPTATFTLTPTLTATLSPCKMSLSEKTQVYAFPSFVNFEKNYSVSEGDVIAQFRLMDEPWLYVAVGQRNGWIVAKQDLLAQCQSLPDYNLTKIQPANQMWPLLFEDTFEVQSSYWLSADDISPRWQDLQTEDNRIWLNAATRGKTLPWLVSGQPEQIRLDIPINVSKWAMTTSFSYLTIDSDSYFGIRVTSDESPDQFLEYRLLPYSKQCRYEIWSYTKSIGKKERSGALIDSACGVGMRFLDPNNKSLKDTYGFLQFYLTNQPERQSVKISFSFNGNPLTGAEISTPGNLFLKAHFSLISSQMWSYVDYMAITGQ
jgi:hypothetical protein